MPCAGCACGKTPCLQQALCLYQSQWTHLLELVKEFFSSTGACEVGLYLKRDMAAEHKAVAARVWEELLQMVMSGKQLCSRDIKQDDEVISHLLQLVTKEWLIWAIDMSDLYARQAVDQLLNKQCTAQGFISKCVELHKAKHCSQASSPAPAPVLETSTPAFRRVLFGQPSPADYTSSGSTGRAYETDTLGYAPSSYQPTTPPRTSRAQPPFVSADGTTGMGSRGGRMHLNSHDNWTYSRHQAHHVRNGTHNEPAYMAADGLTGRGACGAPMYQTRTGTWRYESQR